MQALAHSPDDVHVLNTALLLAVLAEVSRDPMRAAYRFNLNEQQLRFLSGTNLERLDGLIAQMDRCVFSLRPDLERLLDVPPALGGLIAASNPVHATPPSR